MALELKGIWGCLQSQPDQERKSLSRGSSNADVLKR